MSSSYSKMNGACMLLAKCVLTAACALDVGLAVAVNPMSPPVSSQNASPNAVSRPIAVPQRPTGGGGAGGAGGASGSSFRPGNPDSNRWGQSSHNWGGRHPGNGRAGQ